MSAPREIPVQYCDSPEAAFDPRAVPMKYVYPTYSITYVNQVTIAYSLVPHSPLQKFLWRVDPPNYCRLNQRVSPAHIIDVITELAFLDITDEWTILEDECGLERVDIYNKDNTILAAVLSLLHLVNVIKRQSRYEYLGDGADLTR